MNIRKSQEADLDKILQIYANAREQMRESGNPSQWGEGWPPESLIREDIKAGNGYVVEKDGRVCGVFAFLLGTDPTYMKIESGSWKNEEPYGTIHRLDGDGSQKGVFRACLEYCLRKIPNVRMDTHGDNLIMQHLLEKNGCEKCGIIYVHDGTPRIAYQKSL